MNKIRGSILVITLGFFVIFTLFGLSSIYVSGLQNQAIEKQIVNTQAFWLAEAGIQRAIWKLNNDAEQWDGWEATGSGYATVNAQPLGSDGYYDIEITSLPDENLLITAYGYIPYGGQALSSVFLTRTEGSLYYAKRKIQVRLTKNAFTDGIKAKDSIVMSGNATTDSYNSDYGYDPLNPGQNGDVATNGSIEMNGSNALINGDASTGPDGQFLLQNQPVEETNQVTGDIAHDSNLTFPPVAVPAELLALPNEGILKIPPIGGLSGSHKFASIQLTDPLTLSGPTDIYITGEANANISLFIKGPGQLIINGGPVKIYVDGTAVISGQGILNTTEIPSNFLLLGTGAIPDTYIKFSGQSLFYGAIYAPDTEIYMDGQGLPDEKYGIYGAIVGKEVTLGGNAAIHYDESLNDVFYPGKKYSSLRWQEIF